jgi:hypothetical protein
MAAGGPPASKVAFLRWAAGDATFEAVDPADRDRWLGNGAVFFGVEQAPFMAYAPAVEAVAHAQVPIVAAASSASRDPASPHHFLYQAARITVAHPTPRSRATAATAWASLPTRRHASARARSLSTARGRIAATRSVHVWTPQAGSTQRQIRLRQHSTTGRPPIGRSRTRTVRRAWSRAWLPQAAQPTVVAVVWTASRHSSSMTAAAVTSKPSRPSRIDPDALPC